MHCRYALCGPGDTRKVAAGVRSTPKASRPASHPALPPLPSGTKKGAFSMLKTVAATLSLLVAAPALGQAPRTPTAPEPAPDAKGDPAVPPPVVSVTHGSGTFGGTPTEC